ncbi:MAG: hypothetical protein ABI467_25590 [Kofleriaceae bacterium]
MRFTTCGLAVLAGCAHGTSLDHPDDATDSDAPPPAIDAPGAPDVLDAPHVLADAAGCTIAAGASPVLDGSDDLAKYPAGALLTPGAMLGNDALAITWDPTRLYITAISDAFVAPDQPLHVYLEAGTALDAATPSSGKEYSGLVPALPFAPNYLIAARRVSDTGTGPYDGVFVPAASWATRQTPLAPATDVFTSTDQRTLSVVVPWSDLGGCPTTLRLAVHVVHAVAGNEWKDLVPTTHAPWLASGGGYFEIDLTHAAAATNWTLH